MISRQIQDSVALSEIALLCKGKKDVILFLEGAGIHRDDLAAMWLKIRTDRDCVGKYDIVRDVLTGRFAGSVLTR